MAIDFRNYLGRRGQKQWYEAGETEGPMENLGKLGIGGIAPITLPPPRTSGPSVVVTCLKKINSPFADAVDQPVFLGDPARPAACQNELQWLRLADTRERIFHRRLHQLQRPKRCLPIRFHPVQQVLPKLGVKHGIALNPALNSPCQVPSPAAVCRAIPVFPFPVQPALAPPATAAHFLRIAANARSPSGWSAPPQEPGPRLWRHGAERSRPVDH